MKLNLKNIWVLALAGVLGGTSYVLGTCGVTRSCVSYGDLNRFSFTLFEPVLLFSLTALPLALALVFVRDELFGRWLRFARWWIPLSILLITIAPTSSNVWMPLYPDPTKESLAWLMGGLFTLISIVLIVRAARTRKRP